MGFWPTGNEESKRDGVFSHKVANRTQYVGLDTFIVAFIKTIGEKDRRSAPIQQPAKVDDQLSKLHIQRSSDDGGILFGTFPDCFSERGRLSAS